MTTYTPEHAAAIINRHIGSYLWADWNNDADELKRIGRQIEGITLGISVLGVDAQILFDNDNGLPYGVRIEGTEYRIFDETRRAWEAAHKEARK